MDRTKLLQVDSISSSSSASATVFNGAILSCSEMRAISFGTNRIADQEQSIALPALAGRRKTTRHGAFAIRCLAKVSAKIEVC